MRAIIAGGGIGGLCAAIGLRGAGIEAEVHEKAAGLREVGAGLSLWPNALDALDRLRLGGAVRATGAPTMTGTGRDRDGQVIMRLGSGRQGEMIVLHRAELQSLLVNALGRPSVHTGRAVVGFEESPFGVTIRLSDGREVTGDLLIGADGLHSTVRAQLHGARPPVYAGYAAWRGVATFDLEQGEAGESWGCGERFGLVPMSRDRVYWFATANVPAGGVDPVSGGKAQLLQRFGHWHAPIAAVIAATDEASILRNDIYDRPPLKRWSSARVTLLGDAAHATTPNLGQGACQAMEDAAILVRSLCDMGSSPDIAAALRQYDALRIPRTSRIVTLSRRLGQVGQIRHPLLCRLRNALLRAIPAQIQERQVAWVTTFPTV
jgi:2-polyprenyl-6-methoxyphenol hydroxylase-like FAD-dependent oxidoreductase